MNDYSKLLDEELLLLGRYGVEPAKEALASRYYIDRSIHAHRCAPGAITAFRAYESSQGFYMTFQAAVEGYRFEAHNLFRTYFEAIMQKDIFRAYKEQKKKGGSLYLSTPLGVNNNSLTFEDILESSNYDDPKTFINYAEEALLLKHAPKYLTKKCLVVASLKVEKCTYKEISKLTRISVSTAKKLFASFTRFIREAVYSGDLPGLESSLIKMDEEYKLT